MPLLLSFTCGALFGAGLAVSGMLNPQKILAFLDLAGIADGTWDPTLAVVFAAALAPMFLAYRLANAMRKPIWQPRFDIPARTELDARLIGGAALFGAGWGLAGLCPGPAIAALPLAMNQLPELLFFVAAMLLGIWLASHAPAQPAAEPRPVN